MSGKSILRLSIVVTLRFSLVVSLVLFGLLQFDVVLFGFQRPRSRAWFRLHVACG